MKKSNKAYLKIIVLGSGFSAPLGYPIYANWSKQIEKNFKKYFLENDIKITIRKKQSKLLIDYANQDKNNFTTEVLSVIGIYMLFLMCRKDEHFNIDTWIFNNIKDSDFKKILFEKILLKDFEERHRQTDEYKQIGKLVFDNWLFVYSFNYDRVLANHFFSLEQKAIAKNRKEKKEIPPLFSEDKILYVHGFISAKGDYEYDYQKSELVNASVELPKLSWGRQNLKKSYYGLHLCNVPFYICINKIVFIGFGFNIENLRHIFFDIQIPYEQWKCFYPEIIIIDPIYKDLTYQENKILFLNKIMKQELIDHERYFHDKIDDVENNTEGKVYKKNFETAIKTFWKNIIDQNKITFIGKGIDHLNDDDWDLINN